MYNTENGPDAAPFPSRPREAAKAFQKPSPPGKVARPEAVTDEGENLSHSTKPGFIL